MANATVPTASDPSRSSTNFTFTCCAMPASVSVVPCCATSDYAYSDQHRHTRHLGKWPAQRWWVTIEAFPGNRPLRGHLAQSPDQLAVTQPAQDRAQLGGAVT